MSAQAENTAVATRMEAPAPAPASETVAILQMIERAARDPTVDIERFRALMAMRKEIEAEAAERVFDAAMSAAQQEMQPVRADAENPQTRSRYASYAALDKAIRPIYTKHGFSLTFDTADGAPEGHIRVVAKVAHNGGHRERPRMDMPADGKGAKGGDVMTKTHAMGSAVSYGKRYLLGMTFNIAVGRDDDGNAVDGKTITPEQAAEIRKLIEETGAEIDKFCTFMQVEAIPEIQAKDFRRGVDALRDFGKRQKRP